MPQFAPDILGSGSAAAVDPAPATIPSAVSAERPEDAAAAPAVSTSRPFADAVQNLLRHLPPHFLDPTRAPEDLSTFPSLETALADPSSVSRFLSKAFEAVQVKEPQSALGSDLHRLRDASGYLVQLEQGALPADTTPLGAEARVRAIEQTGQIVTFLAPALRELERIFPAPPAPRAPEPAPAAAPIDSSSKVDVDAKRHAKSHFWRELTAECFGYLARGVGSVLGACATVAIAAGTLVLKPLGALMNALRIGDSVRTITEAIEEKFSEWKEKREEAREQRKVVHSPFTFGSFPAAEALRNFFQNTLQEALAGFSKFFKIKLGSLPDFDLGGGGGGGDSEFESRAKLLSRWGSRRSVDLLNESDSSEMDWGDDLQECFGASRRSSGRWRRLGHSADGHQGLGKITSLDSSFPRRLAVMDVYVPVNPNGKMVRLDSILARQTTQQAREAEAMLFRSHEIDSASFPEKPQNGQTLIELPTYSGKVDLPMPAGYSVVAIRFRDHENNALPSGPITVRECVAGSAAVTVPANAGGVDYIVENRKDAHALSPRLISGVLPEFSAFGGWMEEHTAQALQALPLTEADRIAIWDKRNEERGLNYTMHPFVKKFTRAAGSAFYESISGLRLGTCDPFAYLGAIGFSKAGIPGVVVSGISAKDGSFNCDSGHAQTAVLGEHGPQIFDLTEYARERRLPFLSRKSRSSAIHQLHNASASDVHSIGKQVREIWDRGETVNSLTRMLTNVSDSISKGDDPERRWGFELAHPREDSFDFKQNAATHLAHYTYFTALADEAARLNRPSTLLRRLSEFLPIHTVSEQAQSLIPDSFAEARDFTVNKALARSFNAFLTSASVAVDEKAQIVEVIRKDLPPLETVTRPIKWHEVTQFRSTLFSSEDLLIVLGGGAVQSLSNDSLRGIFLATVGQGPRRESSKDASTAWEEVVKLTGDEIIKRGARLSGAEQAALLLHGAMKTKEAPANDKEHDAGDTIVRVFSLGSSNPAEFVRQLQHTVQNDGPRSRLTSGLKTSPDLRAAFFKEINSVECKAEVDALFAEQVRKFPLSNPSYSDRWAKDSNGWKELEIPESLFVPRGKLHRELITQMGDLSSVDPEVIGLPGVERPASELVRKNSFRPSAVMSRALSLLDGGKLCSMAAVAADWPARPEAEIVRGFLNSIIVQEDGRSLAAAEKIDGENLTYWSAQIKDLKELAFDCTVDPLIRALSVSNSYLRQATDDDLKLRRIKELFPQQYTAFVAEKFAKLDAETILKTLYKDFMSTPELKKEAYPAMLWCASNRVHGPVSSISAQMIRGLSSRSPAGWSNEAIANEIQEVAGLLSSPDSITTGLPALTTRGKLGALLTVPGIESEAQDNPIFKILTDDRKSIEPDFQYWSQQIRRTFEFRPSSPESAFAEVCLRCFESQSSDYHRWVSSELNKNGPSGTISGERSGLTFPAFLYRESGRQRVHSPGGDFHEFRDYTPGESVRRIDWRASSRTRNPVIRHNEDIEARPIRYVFDLNLLSTGISSSSQSIERLFTAIQLADKERLPMEVSFLARGFVRSVKIPPVKPGESKQKRWEKVAGEISPVLAGAFPVFSEEHGLFSKKDWHTIPVNLGSRLPVKPGGVYILDLDPMNASAGPVLRDSIRKSGSSVVTFTPAKKIEAEKPVPPPRRSDFDDDWR